MKLKDVSRKPAANVRQAGQKSAPLHAEKDQPASNALASAAHSLSEDQPRQGASERARHMKAMQQTIGTARVDLLSRVEDAASRSTREEAAPQPPSGGGPTRPAATPVSTAGTEPSTATSQPPPAAITLERLEKEEPDVARRLAGLTRTYEAFLGSVDPLLEQYGVYEAKQFDTLLFRRSVERVFQYGRDEVDAKSRYDPRHLSTWLGLVKRVLTTVAPLLAGLKAMEGPAAAEGTYWDTARQSLLGSAESLGQTAFMRIGLEAIEQEQKAAAEQAKIDQAVAYLREYVSRHWRPAASEAELRLHGPVVASRLVHSMRLTGPQIRRTFDTLEAESPDLLNAALFAGSVIWALLDMGVPGFHAYRAKGEGFFAGLRRGERESLLANRPGQRMFSVPQKFEAFGGFVAGLLQGIGDALLSNIKDVLQLFTPKFWSNLWRLLREELPRIIRSEEYRFSIGMMMGQANADEVRRLATAEPFEYGRTVGHIFGSALVEIVLLFIGLGWVLKAVRASPVLMRLLGPLFRLAEKLGRTAFITRGLRVIEVIRESINAMGRRLRLLLARMTAFTRGGRARLALVEAEDALVKATRRVEELEETGRKILASGDPEAAQRHATQMDKALQEFQERVAAWESQGAGVWQPQPPPGGVPPLARGAAREEAQRAWVEASLAEQRAAHTIHTKTALGAGATQARASADEFSSFAVKRVARGSSAKDMAKELGPVSSTFIDTRTGNIEHGLNIHRGKGQPPTPAEMKQLEDSLHPLLAKRLKELRRHLEEVKASGSAPEELLDKINRAGEPGTHSEIIALNKALKAREALGHAVSEADLADFVYANRGLTGKLAGQTVPPPCYNCRILLQGTVAGQ